MGMMVSLSVELLHDVSTESAHDTPTLTCPLAVREWVIEYCSYKETSAAIRLYKYKF